MALQAMEGLIEGGVLESHQLLTPFANPAGDGEAVHGAPPGEADADGGDLAGPKKYSYYP